MIPKTLERWTQRIDAKKGKMRKCVSKSALSIPLDEMEEIIKGLHSQIDHKETIDKLLTLKGTDAEGILNLYARLELYKDLASSVMAENVKLRNLVKSKDEYIKRCQT
jgi:hypothetical protein